MSFSQKGIGLLGLLFIVGIFAAGLWWVFHANYQVLFSDLESQDAGKIVTELEKMKIPYRLAQEGNTILIDGDAVHHTRLKLMAKGLALNSTVGFEIFDKTDFGMTDFAQKINYQRALQGELTRTILSLDEVKAARVHISLPESGFGRRKTKRATASVTLALNQGKHLSPERIVGIQRLVGASLPEIDYRDVTILDQQGIALTAPLPVTEEQGALDFKLQFKKQIEEHLTQKIGSLLDKTLGVDEGLVTVDVSLDNDVIKITREDFSPLPHGELPDKNKQPVVSRQRQTTKTALQRGLSKEGDVLPSNESQQLDIEYQNSRQIEHILRDTGLITRITIGILVPQTVTEHQMKSLETLASMAAGLDLKRGDAIVVSALPTGDAKKTSIDLYEDTLTTAHVENPTSSFDQINIFYGLLGLAGLVILAWMGWWFKQQQAPAEPSLTEEERQALLQRVRLWMSSSSI